MQYEKYAQGALEYLLLIGGAVIVAAVVLTLITGLTATGQQAVGARATDVLCAPYSADQCGIRDPDGTGSLKPGDCVWSKPKSSCSATSLGNGIVLHLTFDTKSSGGTQFSDISGLGNNATLMQAATATPINSVTEAGSQGINGTTAASFDGIDDWAMVAHNPSINIETVTLSFWVKTAQVPAAAAVLAEKLTGAGAYPYLARMRPDGKIQFTIYSSTSAGGNSVTAVNDNQWHNFVGVRDNAARTIKIYVDGLPIEGSPYSYSSTFGSTTNNSPIGIGAYAGPTQSFYYYGLMDNVMLWNRALTEAEITELFNSKN